jgi:hypothetical protein
LNPDVETKWSNFLYVKQMAVGFVLIIEGKFGIRIALIFYKDFCDDF